MSERELDQFADRLSELQQITRELSEGIAEERVRLAELRARSDLFETSMDRKVQELAGKVGSIELALATGRGALRFALATAGAIGALLLAAVQWMLSQLRGS